MLCKYCGQNNPDGAIFCNTCGIPLSDEEIDREMHIKKIRKTISIITVTALIIIAVAIYGVMSLSGIERKIIGTWATELKDSDVADTVTYAFSDGTGSNFHSTKDASQSPKQSDFSWNILDDKTLVIFWSSTSCTKYIWNPNLNNYLLSSNEYNWYISGNTLYLSSTSSEDGYQVFKRQADVR